MGIGINELRALAFGKRLQLLQLDQTVTLGRQQLFFSQSDHDQLFKIPIVNRVKFPTHGFAEPLLKSLDASVVESIDANDYEGASIVADFNRPLESQYHGKFTSFIDFGAIEHIFDSHQVILNINKILRTGGSVLISTLANGFVGHGFYQFSPEFFYSTFSAVNGFAETLVILIDSNRSENWHYVKNPIALQSRNQTPNKKYYIICFTKKTNTVKQINAQQSDYVNLLWKQTERKYILPTKPKKISIKHGIKSFIFQRTPTLLQDLWTHYRDERRSAESFVRQTVMFNPDSVSEQDLRAIALTQKPRGLTQS
jgi:hypothetical protein